MAQTLDLATQPEQLYLGQTGRTHTFESHKGQKIVGYAWPCPSPRAVVHIAHGHGSYICYDFLKNQGPRRWSTYEGSWVEALNKAGYSVAGVDLHGAGRSEGLRCYTDSFEDYVKVVCQHIRLVGELGLPGFPPLLSASEEKGAPRYLMGGSMGGCLSTLVGMRMPDVVAGMILLAPMLSLEKVARRGLNPILKHIAPLMSSLFPKLQCVKVSKNALYPDLQASFDLDPNNWHGNTRARNGYEYMKTCDSLMRGGGLQKVEVPFLVFHGLQDDMCDPDGSRALHERAKSTDKTLKLLPQMWHILVKEPGNTAVLADIIAWLDQHTNTTSDAAQLASLRAEAVAQLEALAVARPDLAKKFSFKVKEAAVAAGPKS